MYEEHPKFDPPGLEATLWRYMDFTKFISLLDTQSLYLARADTLGDPFEGSFPEWNVALRPHRYPEEFLDKISSISQNAREMVFVSCWHECDNESAAMWSLYAREHEGIAIRTSHRSLRDSLKGEELIHIGRITYIDYAKKLIDEGNIFDPYLYKRQEFGHEHEVRAMTCELSSNPPKGIYHNVDLSVLIEGIIIAPYAQDWFDTLVRSVASRYGLGNYVFRSSLAASPSW